MNRRNEYQIGKGIVARPGKDAPSLPTKKWFSGLERKMLWKPKNRCTGH
jgi:hypothetical protein